MRSQFRFVGFSVLTLISLEFFTSAASNGNVYSWETVQLNMRMRNGDYQIETPSEDRCKRRCVENSDCIGVDWHDAHVSCFLFYDSSASPYSANRFRHWRLTRNRSTIVIPNQASSATPTPAGSDALTRLSVNPSAGKHITTQEPNKENEVQTDGIYAWQPVQLDMRVKVGEFRQDLQSETACKDYCLKMSTCAGVFWHNHNGGICILHTDCSATLYHENGFRYWRIRKYIPAASTCHDLIRRVSVDEVSMKCDSQNSNSAANALGILLSFSTVIIIALILNTCRLNRRIQKLAFPRMDVQFVQQIPEEQQQEQEHESIVRPICSNQSSVYMEMVGSSIDINNIYDDLNDMPVQYTTIIL